MVSRVDAETLTKEALMLPSISTRERKISPECTKQLHRIVKEHHICGFVVSWPVQRDTGKMGAPCGHVLFTLESILKLSDNIMTPDRPFCLWDSLNASEQEGEDEWGRCSMYALTSNKTLQLALKARHTQDENSVAAQVWNDFCRAHWPKLYVRKVQRTASRSAWNLVADWKECPHPMSKQLRYENIEQV